MTTPPTYPDGHRLPRGKGGVRPPPGAEARVMTTPPTYPDGHRLLEGKVVLVTAAAGTGIGFATAKRCVEEGATVVVSDKHERRLEESAEQLGHVMGIRPLALPGGVHAE